MADSKYRYLTKIIDSDKFLRDKTYKIAINPKYDRNERGLASMVYKFFDNKKNLQVVVLNLCQINNFQMNLINQLLEILKEDKFFLFII